jgi:hypothetical protein
MYFSLASQEETTPVRAALDAQDTHLSEIFQEDFKPNDLLKGGFRKYFKNDYVVINAEPHNLRYSINFTPEEIFPRHFAVSTTGDGDSQSGVSLLSSVCDKERDWSLHEVDIYCLNIEDAVDHIGFHLKDILNLKQTETEACHIIVMIPPELNQDAFKQICFTKFSISGRCRWIDENPYSRLIENISLF